MERRAVIQALRAAVERDVSALERMLVASREEATGEQSRQENKYDTRALEASYLAAGQGRRLLELQRLAAWVGTLDDEASERARLGSLVLVEDGDRERWILLAPSAGPEVAADDQAITLVSTGSPMGRQLLGLGVDDGFELGDRELAVLDLR